MPNAIIEMATAPRKWLKFIGMRLEPVRAQGEGICPVALSPLRFYLALQCEVHNFCATKQYGTISRLLHLRVEVEETAFEWERSDLAVR